MYVVTKVLRAPTTMQAPNAKPGLVCAWHTPKEQLGEGSHGICRKCANQLLLQQRKLHSRRIAGRK